jgi:hypothetical protein
MLDQVAVIFTVEPQQEFAFSFEFLSHISLENVIKRPALNELSIFQEWCSTKVLRRLPSGAATLVVRRSSPLGAVLDCYFSRDPSALHKRCGDMRVEHGLSALRLS